MRTSRKSIGLVVCAVGTITIVIMIAVFGRPSFDQRESTRREVAGANIISASLSNHLADQPLRFIKNEGQAGTEARFHVQGAGHTVLFNDNNIEFRRIESATERNELVLEFESANPTPVIEGVDRLPGVAHFFQGSNPDRWRRDVPTYGAVIYRDLYPGIDMAYIGDEGVLESEFYLAPGAHPKLIRLKYKNVKSISIRDDGALVLDTELGELVEKEPFAYQDIEGVRFEIGAQYALLPDGTIGFDLGKYDPDYAVVIDPELVFQVTYGASTGLTSASGVAIDSDGNVILAGRSNLTFPVADTINGSNDKSISGLLMKLDGSSGEVIYSALFGGSGIDEFTGLALDQAGNMYLSGITESNDFPIMNPAQGTLAGVSDAFLVILTPDAELTYGTYLGGSDRDEGRDVAIDSTGNVFIAGITTSSDFPTTAGSFQEDYVGGDPDAPWEGDNFVVKYNPAGGVDFATYLGGSGNELVCGIVANASGQLTIAGVTESVDFPLANAYQGTYGGGGPFEGDITVSRLNSDGDGLIYSTYIGGARGDDCSGIALGANDDIFVSGSTSSDNFPIVGGESTPESGFSDGVLVMLDDVGQPVYSVRSNRAGDDAFVEVTVDSDNTASPVSAYADTHAVLEKSLDGSLELVFSFEAPGVRVFAAHAAGGYLTLAGDRDPSDDPSTKFDLFTLLMNLGRVDVSCRLTFGALVIEINEGNAVPIRIAADENGKVTVNGLPKDVNAADVTSLSVTGSEGDDDIDCSEVTIDDFPRLTFALIRGRGGNDKLKGPEVGSVLAGGPGNDEVVGGPGDDAIYGGDPGSTETTGDDILDGRGGNDYFNYGGSGASRHLGAKGDAAPYSISDVLVVVDSVGIDTLDFSKNGIGITLNLDLMGAGQPLDSLGTLITLFGDFEVVLGSEFDDEITVSPLADVGRHIDGGGGVDVLNHESPNGDASDDGSTITTPGLANVTYVNVETVNLSVVTAIDPTDTSIPESFRLSQNYPNPFNPSTTIRYSLPEQSSVSLKLYNSAGQQIATLVNEQQQTGNYLVSFDASELSSGSYFYVLRAGEYVSSRMMLLVK